MKFKKRNNFRFRCNGWKSVNRCGSRYKAKNVPNFYLNDEKPTLNNNWEDNANPKWGAPSCGSFYNQSKSVGF